MTMKAPKASLFRSFLLAVTLATGFGTLWLVLTSWIGNSVLQAWQDKSQIRQESLVVATDGTPLIQSYPLDNLSLMSYRDLDGNVRDSMERKDMLPPIYLPGEQESGAFSSNELSWQQRIEVFMDEREPAAVWYFVHDGRPDGAGYFVGYERVSNRRIGYIGLSGFRADPVPDGDRLPVSGDLMLGFSSWSSIPLAIDSRWGRGLRPDRSDLPPRLVHVPSENRLRLVDLSARTVSTVFESAEPIVSVGVPALASYSVGEPTFPRPILVRTGQVIYKLDHAYKVIGAFHIPAEVDREGLILWYETRDGQAVVQCFAARPAGEAPGGDAARSTLYRLASDGAIRDSREVSLQSGGNASREQAERSLIALALPMPFVLVAAETFMPTVGRAERHPASRRALLKQTWPSLLAVLVLSSLLAAVAWRRARVFGLSTRERAVWAAFVLLFGLPAFVGFLLHRPWPVREPCPACHARSARDRETCSECGAAFPAPALKGIENFA
jgi:hypothetical protein